MGNVNKILTSLNERPYGKHAFQAALLMRQGILLGGMLSNAESWTNVTEIDIHKLTMPDTMLHRELLSTSGNPSKVFMSLELGIIPVKFALMAKRVKMLNCILNENINTTMRQVYETLKGDSKRGDFYDLVGKDLQALNIEMEENEISSFSKQRWKKYVAQKTKESAFQYLVTQNSILENTKHIFFEDLKLSNYLRENRSTKLAKIIFSIRSKTFDIKSWQPWKYFDNLCVQCELREETMDHFMCCKSYENCAQVHDWKIMFENDTEKQYEIAQIVSYRQRIRKHTIDKYEAGQPQVSSGSGAPAM